MKIFLFISVFAILFNGSSSDRDYYGAIAYSSETGSIGHSGDHYTNKGAKKAALRACRQNLGLFNDCKVVVTYVNGCGALAISSAGYGTGYGGNKNSAQRRAIASCDRIRNKDDVACKVALWSCTSK